MRFVQSALIMFAIAAQSRCSPAAPSLPAPAPCEALPPVDFVPGWNPRALAGEYRITWVSQAGAEPAQRRDRLWLWPTSMRDSSTVRHRGPASGDTVQHPLYGFMRSDTGRFDASQVEELRRTIDPIYPPVLLYTTPKGITFLRDNPLGVLLLGTAGNRRDGAVVLDGLGMGMEILEANAEGFRGNFGRWGVASTDSGYFCAQRARP